MWPRFGFAHLSYQSDKNHSYPSGNCAFCNSFWSNIRLLIIVIIIIFALITPFYLADILEGLRPGSPKPGHIERIVGNSSNAGDNSQAEENADKSDDPVITQRFLKINVRHITDGQGVVGGVLLVTRNAVMFDPNVSDPLVIEHGPESYGVIAPMDLVVNAAIFHDIAHMRVAGGAGPSAAASGSETEKPEIYYPKPVLVEEDSKELSEQQADLEANKQRLEGKLHQILKQLQLKPINIISICS